MAHPIASPSAADEARARRSIRKAAKERERAPTFSYDVGDEAGVAMLGNLAPAFVRSILDSSPDCIKLVERDGTLSFMNRNGRCAMEIDSFDLVNGAKWSNLWPEDGQARIAQSVDAALEGRTDRFEAYCPTAKGDPRWWDVSVAPILGPDGRPERIVSISRDITERVERERAMAAHEQAMQDLALRQAHTLEEKEELLREKELLMQEVDHRVKNSLAMINALLSMQGRRVTDERAREALLRASTRVQTIAAIHERLYRSGSTGTLDIDEYLRALCEDLMRSASDTGVEVACGTIGIGIGSGEKAVTLGLIVSELVSNAIRHAQGDEDRTCTVTVRCGPVTDGGSELVVEDDGCGLPDDFDPSASKGLGMRVVLGNLQRLGGELRHERPDGGGTRFALRF